MCPESTPSEGASQGATVLVDAHVHLHPRYDEGRFFDAALRNFREAAEAMEVGEDWHGVLVFTEVSGVDRFGALVSRSGDSLGGGWTVEATSEEVSLRLRRREEERGLTVVAGRQVQTAEGLEVLCFPLRRSISDGLPILDVLRLAPERGSLSVVPWGFGKWMGRRGRTLRALLDHEPELPFLLADTGHRPRWLPGPSRIRGSEPPGRPIVTGSDPLPLPGEEARAGSCCFTATVHGFEERPAEGLRAALAALDRSPERYERRAGIGRMTTSQVGMQIRKRTR